MSAPLLQVRELKKYYPVRARMTRRLLGQVKAVDNVSFDIAPGEVLGLVGESGCGKSTTGYTLLRLEEATSGEAVFEGRNILSLPKKEMKAVRRDIQMIFQDSFSSMNPHMRIGDVIREPLAIHGFPRQKQNRRLEELLDMVGLTREQAGRFPHEFSGGQRQRAGIARALALGPRLLIADEPVSALDVSIQAQIINLMQELQRELGLSYLFIAHDLSVVKHISDRIAVMYLGKIVEICGKDQLYENPLHPYTHALLSAVPIPDPTVKREREGLAGELPSPLNPPTGCRFHPRCPLAMGRCSQEEPLPVLWEDGHLVACHLYGNGTDRRPDALPGKHAEKTSQTKESASE